MQLTSDIAKLKAKGSIDAINKNKLTLLINFAMRNVDVAKNYSAGPVSSMTSAHDLVNRFKTFLFVQIIGYRRR